MISLVELQGYADENFKGLYRAKPGDNIEIGFEGSRVKYTTKIDKIVSNGRLQDTEGNIFDRNGIIYRKKGSWVKFAGDKIISARQITIKEYEKNIMQFINKQLHEFDYTTLPISSLQQIGKIIGRSFPQLDNLKS